MERNRIETYVFIALGVTGPIMKRDDSYTMPDITELSMLAVKRRKLFLEPDSEPRVQCKFHMCFKPRVTVYQEMSEAFGLNDFLLTEENEFDRQAFNAVSSFINCLERPVCLIAHDGFNFQFPILKYHFKNLKVELAGDIKCSDSLLAFYDLDIIEYCNGTFPTIDKDMRRGYICTSTDLLLTKGSFNEAKEKSYFKLYRYQFYSLDPTGKPYKSYHLVNIYKRCVKDINYEYITAENACFMMMKIAQSYKHKGFEGFIQENHCAFSEVPTIPPFKDTTIEDLESSEGNDSSGAQASSSILYNIFNFLWPQF